MKYVCMLLSLALLCSCSSPFWTDELGYKVMELPLEEAWRISAAIPYIPDDEGFGYWKSPRETDADGGGDCEDIATYLVYLLGPSAEMLVISGGAFQLHAVVRYNNEILEPQSYGNKYHNVTIFWSLDYYQVMSAASDHGSKSIDGGTL